MGVNAEAQAGLKECHVQRAWNNPSGALGVTGAKAQLLFQPFLYVELIYWPAE